MALKRIVYLKKEDYNTLKDTGTVIVDGKTITYSEDDDYRVPDETQEQIADLQAEQAVQSAKITTLQSAVSNLVLEGVYPLYSKEGNPVNNRYVQFPDQPEPAEIFGGNWELDEDAMDKFLIGAGNLYALGATGGSADAVVVKHSHSLQTTYSQSGNDNSTPTANSSSIQGVQPWLSAYTETYETGEDGTNKNLPPYLAVNIWKRTA